MKEAEQSMSAHWSLKIELLLFERNTLCLSSCGDSAPISLISCSYVEPLVELLPVPESSLDHVPTKNSSLQGIHRPQCT